MIIRLFVSVLCASLLVIGPPLWAQQPTDPIGDSLFPPELVIQHQQAIGLSADQKDFIKAEIQKAQTRFTELQWQLQNEMETMVSLLKQDRGDEKNILSQLDRVLSLEREVKRTQITLLVRIKNKLTPEQQSRLQEIKNKLRGK